jgi:hypothetical protein
MQWLEVQLRLWLAIQGDGQQLAVAVVACAVLVALRPAIWQVDHV